jgi:hypothetical protein
MLDLALMPVLTPAARWVPLEFPAAVWVRAPPAAAHLVSLGFSTLQSDLAFAPGLSPAVLREAGWDFHFVWVLMLTLALTQLSARW